MLMTPKGMEAMVAISKENPGQTSPVERALRYHADSKLIITNSNRLYRKRLKPNKTEPVLSRDDGRKGVYS